MIEIDKNQLTALILAGGKSSRMKGIDKGLMQINNKYVIQHLYSLAQNFCAHVLINANKNLESYDGFGYKVCMDSISGYLGPLAGMYTGLKESSTEYLITLPCDGPFINESYIKKMILLESDSDINVAFDGKRLQPVYCLINKSLLGNLERFLQSGERKIDKWFELCSVNYIDFSNNKDLFININNEEDLNQHKEKIENILNKNE